MTVTEEDGAALVLAAETETETEAEIAAGIGIETVIETVIETRRPSPIAAANPASDGHAARP